MGGVKARLDGMASLVLNDCTQPRSAWMPKLILCFIRQFRYLAESYKPIDAAELMVVACH